MPPAATAIRAFERTNFFYGLMLDADRLQKDHAYFNEKRALLNRLTVGFGVVCGFHVRAVAGPPQQWFVDPGVAIDGLGREVVVPESRAFDPAQPTDDKGRPSGTRLTTGTVEIRLAYNEIGVDPVPVLVPDCDAEGECAPSVVREGFVVIVRSVATDAKPGGCTLPEFPVPPAPGLHDLLAKRLRTGCREAPADPSIPIASMDLSTGDVDADSGRPIVYSNQVLYEAVVCLAQHIASASNRTLRYIAGDSQSAPAGTTLPVKLEVELTDALNNPVAAKAVQFAVTGDGGSLPSATVTTAADGRASIAWTLGPTAGPQQVTATAKDAPFAVTFRATAV
jgi:hypothetical protein